MPRKIENVKLGSLVQRLQREFERENPGEEFTIEACVEALMREMHKDEPKPVKSPRKKK